MKDIIYLKHILESINIIENSLKNLTKEQFKSKINVQDSAVRRLEIIGEAVKNLSNETRNKYTQMEWKKIAGMRDVLIHAYFSVDYDLVWNIIKDDLPKLKKNIDRMLKELE